MPKTPVDRKISLLAGRHGDVQHSLLAHELQVLLMGGDPEATGVAPLWRPIQPRQIEHRDTPSPD